MFCVAFIDFNGVISYLQEFCHFRISATIIFQETKNDRKLPHLLTRIKAKTRQGGEFNNEIILLNAIILSYTGDVP